MVSFYFKGLVWTKKLNFTLDRKWKWLHEIKQTGNKLNFCSFIISKLASTEQTSTNRLFSFLLWFYHVYNFYQARLRKRYMRPFPSCKYLIKINWCKHYFPFFYGFITFTISTKRKDIWDLSLHVSNKNKLM